MPVLKHFFISLMAMILLFNPGCATKGEALKQEKQAEAQTAPEKDAVAAKEEAKKVSTKTSARPPVTLQTTETSSLNETVRKIGETAGGACVVMNGLGERPVAVLNYEKTPYKKVMEELAANAGCVYVEMPNYGFIYDSNYAVLLEHQLEPKLRGRLPEAPVSLAVGDNTPLFNVLALIGQTLGVTMVADNALAETPCGEIALNNVPLWAALEAVLASARVAPNAYTLEATPEYLFIRTVGIPEPQQLLLNEKSLTDADKTLLDKMVRLGLPQATAPSDKLVFHLAAATLADSLNSMSLQWGVRVEADPRMAEFPVNPCVFRDMRLRTAVELLIRQWPTPQFGYEIKDGKILIRPR